NVETRCQLSLSHCFLLSLLYLRPCGSDRAALTVQFARSICTLNLHAQLARPICTPNLHALREQASASQLRVAKPSPHLPTLPDLTKSRQHCVMAYEPGKHNGSPLEARRPRQLSRSTMTNRSVYVRS